MSAEPARIKAIVGGTKSLIAHTPYGNIRILCGLYCVRVPIGSGDLKDKASEDKGD